MRLNPPVKTLNGAWKKRLAFRCIFLLLHRNGLDFCGFQRFQNRPSHQVFLDL